MSNFNFVARDNTGSLIKGTRTAGSSDSVYKLLLQENLTPIKIDKIAENASQDLDTYIQSKFPNSKKIQEQKLIYCRQMASLLGANVSIIEAISTVADSTRHKYFKKVLYNIISDLQEGSPISCATEKHKAVFGNLFIGALKIGEKSGKLNDSFKYLANYYGETIRNRFKLKEAIRHPMIIFIVFIIAMVVINIVFFPSIKKAYDKYNGELPIITHIMIGIAEFITNYWYIAIGLVMLLYMIYKRALKVDKIKYAQEKFVFKIPVYGWLKKRVLIERFCQAFVVCLRSGYSVDEGLLLVKDAVDNKYFASLIKKVAFDLREGKTFYQAALDAKFFPPLFLRLLETSRKTGNLSEVLEYISKQYAEELEYEFKYITEYIRPVLMIVVGVCVGIFVLSVFVPYYKLFTVIIQYMNTPR